MSQRGPARKVVVNKTLASRPNRRPLGQQSSSNVTTPGRAEQAASAAATARPPQDRRRCVAPCSSNQLWLLGGPALRHGWDSTYLCCAMSRSLYKDVYTWALVVVCTGGSHQPAEDRRQFPLKKGCPRSVDAKACRELSMPNMRPVEQGNGRSAGSSECDNARPC